jgi:hypothetical protein
VHIEIGRHARLNLIEELAKFLSTMPQHLPITFPVAISSAANSDVVPWRV